MYVREAVGFSEVAGERGEERVSAKWLVRYTCELCGRTEEVEFPAGGQPAQDQPLDWIRAIGPNGENLHIGPEHKTEYPNLWPAA